MHGPRSFFFAVLAAAASSSLAAASPSPGLLSSLLNPILNLAANPPPKFLITHTPSPECAAINGGQLQCCRDTVAGDIQLVVWLAAIYGYSLNPNDINGLDCKRFIFFFSFAR